MNYWEIYTEILASFCFTRKWLAAVLYSEWANSSPDNLKKEEFQRLAFLHKEKALDLSRAALGELDLNVAVRYHNISIEYYRLGDVGQVLACAVRAASILFAMLEQGLIDDPNHPQLSEYLNYLESDLRILGRNPGDAKKLALAEVPNVLADHAAWKSRKARGTMSEDMTEPKEKK